MPGPLLGGDALVGSDKPAPPELLQRATELGLRSATSASFPSMGRAPDEQGGASRLVAVKAVSDAYPLRGQLRLKSAPEAAERNVAGAPARGTVWVDAALLDALQLKVGDDLLLGDAALRITQIIVIEPDRGAGFMSFAPRVMLNQADLAETGLIQPASRVSYRLAVAAPAGREAAVREFVAWAEDRIKSVPLRGVRVESLQSGRPEMRQTLDRAEKFLNLVALLAALLAAVAVGIAARDFAQRHLNDCAMQRVLGLSQARIAGAYTLEFAGVGVLASAIGVALGFGVHYVFVWLLAGLVNASLPMASVWPALFGLGVGMTLLLGFGLPPVLQLARVPPLRVMRRDVGALKASSALVLAAGAAGFVALLLAVSSDLKLGLIAVGGFAAAVALFALLSWLAVQLLKRAVPETRAPRWLVLATRQIAARPAFAVLQVSALAVGLLALVLLVLLRTDLIDSWRKATPPDAPNRFVINLQPDQAEAFKAALAAAGVTRYDWFPMIRGRLVAINGQPVNGDRLSEDRAKRLVEREFNLSHAAAAPAHNVISAGRWVADEADAISVEDGLAETLGVKLGDRLRFDIAGQLREGRITSLRKVDWASMRVNFFVMFPQAQMPGLPISYISAFRAPERAGFDNRLSRDFPNITNVDVSASDRPGAARAGPGGARGRVPVRLHAGRRAGGAVRRGQRHARGAGPRIRPDARDGRQRPAAGAGAAHRAAGRGRAGRLPGVAGGHGRRLGDGALCLRVQLESLAMGAAAGRGSRCAAGAGGRLVGAARGAAPPGHRHACAQLPSRVIVGTLARHGVRVRTQRCAILDA